MKSEREIARDKACRERGRKNRLAWLSLLPSRFTAKMAAESWKVVTGVASSRIAMLIKAGLVKINCRGTVGVSANVYERIKQ